MPSLEHVSTAALVAELARRKDDVAPRSPIIPCDECGNFEPFTGPVDQPIPADFNPCRLGYKMSLRVPQSTHEEVWGLYRRNCRDREERS